MAIREDLVASAANFLQDPSVSASTPESRVAFLKSKNLTPEEISAALARAGFDGGNGTAGPGAYAVAAQHPQGAQVASQQPPPYGHNSPYGPPPNFPPYGWQPSPPPPPPRRDWRDWFIMATVVGGVGYGLFSMTKRYIYPLVAPPTPDRLAQDKEAIDAQFARAFALVEQLAQDTEALKTAEQARTERLDQALANLEAVLTDLQTASKRREDDAARLRDDVRGLKDALPRALDTQREVTDGRLREVNTELKGLKTLLGQRLAASSSSSGGGSGGGNAVTNGGSVSGSPAATSTPLSYLRASGGSGGGVGGPATSSTASAPPVVSIENESTEHAGPAVVASSTTNNGAATPAAPGVPTSYSPAGSSNGTASPTLNTLGKAAIPAWQRAMLKPSSTASSPAPTATTTNGAGSSSSSSVQPEASGSA
ncbi:peroxisomal membrane anchor protein [Niveomyces insectorum RCEF 264]|uniref:Peroxisomal membrane protein PEX14 n=1 Tax=Niveomyces insectorum RCEF 264 TaxID=1081102 RepID=A0A162JDI3_9HYPO|nr:peroxisomal membrane anchor protein [Niveomyces insectorum RCEF 264]